MAERTQKHTENTKAPAARTPTISAEPLSPQPLAFAPALQSAADALSLQRAIGNQRVNRLIQAKLTVGAANDPLEREADRVADQVVSRSSIQRNPEEDELQASRMDVSRAPAEEDELMTKRNGMLDSFDAGSDFEQQLGASGSGKPLDNTTRSQMESGIGADFGNVRVHTGSQASSLNRSISAQSLHPRQRCVLRPRPIQPGQHCRPAPASTRTHPCRAARRRATERCAALALGQEERQIQCWHRHHHTQIR